MSVFLEIAEHYAVADAAFVAVEQKAYQEDDDVAFDRAALARRHNDQAYFLCLFSRFEAEVSAVSKQLVANRLAVLPTWSERRIWQAWSGGSGRDPAFLSKIEVLTEKGRQDYATIQEYYDGRNTIAHGGVWQARFVVPNVAQTMNDLLLRFATN
jgi:hypothetical protein